MPDTHRIAVGIAWYRPEQWSLLLSLIPDPEVFPATYTEWLAGAADTFRRLGLEGLAVRKVDVDINALVAWAAAQGRAPDGAVRAEYAQHLLGAGDDVRGS